MKQRFLGSLMGLGVGDAYGVPFEWKEKFSYMTRDSIDGLWYVIKKPITPPDDMVASFDAEGNIKTQVGQWSDDLSLALCLAKSLVDCGEHNPRSQMRNYRDWLIHGILTATGVAYGSGRTMRTAVEAFEKEEFAYFTGDIEGGKIGNGSVMRLAPIVMFNYYDKHEAITKAMDTSRVTHSDPVCLDMCAIFAELIWKALRGYAKEDVLAKSQVLRKYVTSLEGIHFSERDWNKVKAEQPENNSQIYSNIQVEASGYAPKSMEAGIWCFCVTDTFVDGMKLALSLGGDTDSTCSIFGQLAGAYYGIDAIPYHWQNALMKNEYVHYYAQKLLTITQTK